MTVQILLIYLTPQKGTKKKKTKSDNNIPDYSGSEENNHALEKRHLKKLQATFGGYYNQYQL